MGAAMERRPRTYKRDGFKMVECQHPDDGRRRAYEVAADDGTRLGMVGCYMETMEKRQPGKRYVERRWQSMRWWAQRDGEAYRFRGFRRPGEAAEFLRARAKLREGKARRARDGA